MTSFNDVFKKEIVYKLDSVKEVSILKDISYKVVGNEELLMDVYAPLEIKEGVKLPVVVLIHGEAPIHDMKEAGQYISLGNLIAASGMIAVTFNHRMLRDGAEIKEVNSDIESLINYLSQKADTFNIDINKIAIWGISAGVPFGLYSGIKNNNFNIKGVIAYYGYGDFKHVEQSSKLDIEEYSPVNLLKENSNKIPPLFIARAGLDNPTLNESLDNFIMKALSSNIAVDVYNHPEGRHAFDLFNDNERTHEIIEKTLGFLKKIFLV